MAGVMKSLDAPIAQAMTISDGYNAKSGGGGSFLADLKGVVLRQHLQVGEIVAQSLLGLPFERANRYEVKGFPNDKRALHSQADVGGWKPLYQELVDLPTLALAQEKSSFCERFFLGCWGCMNLRSLQMPVTSSRGVEFTIERPLNLGGCFGCPHTTNVSFPGMQGAVGRVQEDMHCGKNYVKRALQTILCCRAFYNIDMVGDSQALENKYQMEVNLCCCGPHNNFLGATCFRNDIVLNVYKFNNRVLDRSQPVGYVQKTFGSTVCGASSARCLFDVSNWLIEFPDRVSEFEKALFIAAAINTEYVYFERNGSE